MQFCSPHHNILQIGLREGLKVGDLGSGTGHYALAAASIVGESGRVYAVDVQEEVLKSLRQEAALRGLTNIETIWSDFEKPGGTKLRDHSLDVVLLSNTLFQLDHKEGALAEIKRILKPGGKLLVVDWAGSYEGIGPHPDTIVTEYAAEDLFITGGFHKVKSFRAGPHHYSIVFTAP